MEILSEVKRIAKENDWVLAHHDPKGNIYIFRDRNITDTKKLDIDSLEHYYMRHGESATRQLIQSYFE